MSGDRDDGLYAYSRGVEALLGMPPGSLAERLIAGVDFGKESATMVVARVLPDGRLEIIEEVCAEISPPGSAER